MHALSLQTCYCCSCRDFFYLYSSFVNDWCKGCPFKCMKLSWSLFFLISFWLFEDLWRKHDTCRVSSHPLGFHVARLLVRVYSCQAWKHVQSCRLYFRSTLVGVLQEQCQSLHSSSSFKDGFIVEILFSTELYNFHSH